ncbi:MAG: antibiotic biosynthesis monooxygenase [Planctomycetota bacterium]
MKNDRGAPVTVLLSRRVKEGLETEFEGALAEHLEAVQRLPGHLGVNVFKPAAGSRDWTSIFKFSTEADAEAWRTSTERATWDDKARHLTDGSPRMRVSSGLETWFTIPELGVVPPPPRWKVAIATWLVIYPTITALLLVFGRHLDALPVAGRTLLLTAALVPLMTFLLMPTATRVLRRWLYPR